MFGKNKTSPGVTCLCFLCLTLLGCGGDDSYPRAAVQGIVSLDGKPLREGRIRFVPIEGTPGQKVSVAVKLGNFAIDSKIGPAAGKHRIEIETTDFGGLAMDDEDAINRLEMQRTKRVKVTQVPAKYSRSSVLAETLSANELNELSFELTSKRRQ